MIISSTEKQVWYENQSADKKGIELTVSEERQKIRGFGTCFSELGAFSALSGKTVTRCTMQIFMR